MKMTHYLFSEPIDFSISNVQQLVFEDPDDMGKALRELDNQFKGFEGRFVLSKGDRILDIGKDCTFIKSPIDVGAFDKQIMLGILTSLSESLHTQGNQQIINDYISGIENWTIVALDELEAPVLSYGMDKNKLLKALEMELDHPIDICEDTLQACKLLSKYSKQKLIVISSISSVIGKERRELLLRDLAYLNIPLLIIDSEYVPGYPCKIIDADFCEINLKSQGSYLFEV